MNPKYPVYVISKGRHETRMTSRCFEAMGLPYRIVVEPQEFDAYAAHIDKQKILVLPFSNLNRGSIPARNWVWEHSISEGHERHWICDDNIRNMFRFNRNNRIPMRTPTGFAVMEQFVDRYTNLAMAGPQYFMFAPKRWAKTLPPVSFNTRVYSCILLSNADHGLRWRGKYNEDTDLSIRFLKAGYCTALFYAFLADKQRTMTMKGGNTDLLYRMNQVFDGRLAMARSLKRQHPELVKIKWKWNRWQHSVDYRPFRGNKLIRRKDVKIRNRTNNYGMKAIVLQTGEQLY